MPVYLVVSMTVHDTGWVEDYQRNAPPMVEKHGGRFLAPSAPPVLIEGEGPLPQSMAVLEFPSLEAVKALQDDPAYQPYLEARQAGATTLVCALSG